MLDQFEVTFPAMSESGQLGLLHLHSNSTGQPGTVYKATRYIVQIAARYSVQIAARYSVQSSQVQCTDGTAHKFLVSSMCLDQFGCCGASLLDCACCRPKNCQFLG